MKCELVFKLPPNAERKRFEARQVFCPRLRLSASVGYLKWVRAKVSISPSIKSVCEK